MFQSQINNPKPYLLDRQQWLAIFLLMVCFVAWFVMRFDYIYMYQIPPHQTIHPNYYTFHDMSQSWLSGKKLGVIDVSRMLINSHRLMVSDYLTHVSSKDTYCTYLALDPGFGVIVTVARALMFGLPDSYLRTESLQLICDGIMLFAIFLTFLRMGPWSAAAAGLLYAVHPVFAYQAIFPFQYFWEGWLFAVAFLSIIWARRCVLSEKRIVAIVLIILAALAAGFVLWVRSTALIVALAVLLVFLTVPSLRRYCGIFFLVFALTICPQVMRASSVMGHFALSTRMSWHTAFQALGHYPNQYGLEDEDLYVFKKTEQDHGIQYNYCDYSKHDAAAHEEFMAMWHKDPGYVTRSIVSRIITNVLFNYDFDLLGYGSLLFSLMGLVALLYALRRGGENLFIAGMMAVIYLGYCGAVGLVYYMAPPYAYVAQLALLFMLPSFVQAVLSLGETLVTQPSELFQRHYWDWDDNVPIAKKVFTVVIVLAFTVGGGLLIPSVRDYIFPNRPYQNLWILYGQPSLDDNQKLMHEWEGLHDKRKKAFLDLVYKNVPKTDNVSYDVSHYIADNLQTMVYLERTENEKEHALFTYSQYKVDALQALDAISLSILGWRSETIELFNIEDPDSWDGRKIHIKLIPTSERAGVDYQGMAKEKFARFNYEVTWLGPNELVARHNDHGCDALRTVLGIFYHGYCPYDPGTGPSPLTTKPGAKSLTFDSKTGS